VITGDLDAALCALAATLPGGPAASSCGTWRLPRPGTRPAAARAYATSVPFILAKDGAGEPGVIAGALAAGLRRLPWVESASVTGAGYLTVAVTARALRGLAVRIPRAGPACARSHALTGTVRSAPAPPDLARAATWQRARELLAATVVARLAQAAGAQVTAANEHGTERFAAPTPPVSEPTVVAGAIGYAGADTVAYTLARLPAHAPAHVDARLAAAHHLGNPAYAVRYAHAHAVSTRRQAATLGLGLGEAPALELLAHPRERSLLYELSWLPERAGEGARRERPDVLTRYLETVADAYLGCQEHCPAVPPGVRGTGPARELTVARLWLATAAATVLRTGLGLLGVTAPERL
jgi:arginyl-tRNA synthetase